MTDNNTNTIDVPSRPVGISRRLSQHPLFTGEYKIPIDPFDLPSTLLEPTEAFTEPIFEQQPGEPDAYYVAFLQFCALPLGKRTLVQATKAFTGIGAKEYRRDWNYEGIARKWLWPQRAARRDIYLSKQSEEQWLQRDIERRERIFDIGNRLIDAGQKGLTEIDEESVRNPMAVTRLISLGHELTEAAIPRSKLDPEQVSEVLGGLPDDRRKNVLEILMARITKE